MQKQANCTKETKMEKRWTKPPQTDTNTLTHKNTNKQTNTRQLLQPAASSALRVNVALHLYIYKQEEKVKRIRFNIYNWEDV